MGYRSALRLAEMAKQANMLDDPLAKKMIMAVAVTGDPEIEQDAEEYIGSRAIENIMSRHRKPYTQE